MNDYFESIRPENVLSENSALKCEGLFTKQECFGAIQKMKRNKSPGLDGISVEFYEKFWSLIGDLLVSVFNDSYEQRILPDSQRMSVFSSILRQEILKI